MTTLLYVVIYTLESLESFELDSVQLNFELDTIKIQLELNLEIVAVLNVAALQDSYLGHL